MRQILCFMTLVAIAAMSVGYLCPTHEAPLNLQDDIRLPALIVAPSTVPPTLDSCMPMTDRNRGWCLFASLVGGSNGPAWQGWSPVPIAGTSAMPCPAAVAAKLHALAIRSARQMPTLEATAKLRKVKFLRALSEPVQLILPNDSPPTATKLSTKSLNLLTAAAVLYNDTLNAAVCNLRTQDGSLRSALSAPRSSGMLTVSTNNGVEIAVKTVWASVPITAVSPTLQIWDDQPLDGKRNPVGGWKHPARLDLTHPDTCVFPAKLDPNHWAPGGGPSMSLGCFYYMTVQQADLDNLTKDDGSIINQAAAGVAVDRAYLVLMGFHIAARAANSNSWTWQTFWWSGATFDTQDAEAPLLAGNPLQDQPKWSHYVMKTMIDTQPFNPYLEAQLANGKDSDCVSCHSRATYYASPPNTASQVTAFFQNAQDCALIGACTAAPKGLQTDSLWTLGDSNVAGLRHAD